MQTPDLPDYWKTGTPCVDQEIADQLSNNNLIGAFFYWAAYMNVHFDCASNYGEPGYVLPEGKTLIILANWNDVPEEMVDLLEKAGYELEWSDEWVVDYGYDKAWRTEPDSYIWMSSIRDYNGDLLTTDDDPERWAQYLTEKPNRVAHPSVDLESIGFVPCGDIRETGLHRGQNDDPSKVLAALGESLFGKLDPESDEKLQIAFRLIDVGQFDVRWEALYRIVTP